MYLSLHIFKNILPAYLWNEFLEVRLWLQRANAYIISLDIAELPSEGAVPFYILLAKGTGFPTFKFHPLHF